MTVEDVEQWRGYLLTAHKDGTGLNGDLNRADINALCDLALASLRALPAIDSARLPADGGR